ncbi:hypothetical protein [Streptomyces sp. NPDC059455]|uniref:hypothetical protein n=1 Tax=Streptomyces sp. NPDC059455 TaxID=3346837 RepID=UPI00367AD30B
MRCSARSTPAASRCPKDRPIARDLTGLRHQDHVCTMALMGWAERHSADGVDPVRLIPAR